MAVNNLERIAVFIDADNAQAEKIEDVLMWFKNNNIYFKNKNDIENMTFEDIKIANEERKRIESRLSEVGANYISYYSKEYPYRFKMMEDFPVILYYKGDISLINSEKICGIIGTRTPNKAAIQYGLKIAESKTRDGYIVLSGLAEGCDTIGHRGCLNENGKTIAIVGTGVDQVYPKSNLGLEKEILETGGLILSEYPVGFKGASYSFVQRDRLQAAGSDEIILIQSKINGGSMHASKASVTKYNKKLFVLDPDLLMEDCDGNKLLIKEYNASIIKV